MDLESQKYKDLVEKLKKYFTFYPDFPKKGILFWDMFALFRTREAFSVLVSLIELYADSMRGKIDGVAGIEARGFLFGPIIAKHLDIIFIPIRKKGKLPGKVEQVTYSLEYGTDTLEIQEGCIKSGQKIVVVDDCLVTGGTLLAACSLIHRLGAKVVDCMVVINMADQSKQLDLHITSLCPCD